MDWRVLAISAVFGVAISVLHGLWTNWLKRSSPVEQTPTSGTIRPERIAAWLSIFIGLAIFALTFGYATSEPNASVVSVALVVAVGLIGIAIAGSAALSLTSIHSVSWDEIGIAGPSKTFGPTLGWARTHIEWNDIARAGSTLTDYTYVESHDKRRIYWSYFYKGHGALLDALVKHDPNEH